MKKVLFLLLLSLCYGTSFADPFPVDRFSDFVRLAKQVKEGVFDFDVVLNTDLDFSDSTLLEAIDYLPLGGDISCNVFTGSFEGNGHVIKNLVMPASNAYSGLFCGGADAVVQNLIIDESCQFHGTKAGIVFLDAKGSVTIRNVSVSGTQKMENCLWNS